MSVRLYNKKTGHTAACERADWTACRDHSTNKGWTLFTPEHLNTPERQNYLNLINSVIDNDVTDEDNFTSLDAYNSYGDDIDDVYEAPLDDPRSSSEDYKTRAAALNDRNILTIRQQGLGSNFEVANINPDDDTEWTGNCTSCGARVSNYGSKGWEHPEAVYSEETVTQKNLGLCPAVTK